MQGRGKIISSIVLSVLVIVIASYIVWKDNEKPEETEEKDSVREQVTIEIEALEKLEQKKLEVEYMSLKERVKSEEDEAGSAGIHYNWEYANPLFEKYDGEELVWALNVDEVDIKGYEEFEDGLILYGRIEYEEGQSTKDALWMIRIDNDGNVVWEKSFTDSADESVDVLIIQDGMIHAITRVDTKSTTGPTWNSLLQLDMDGNVINRATTDVGKGVTCATLYNGSFYIALWANNTEEYIMKLNTDGSYENVVVCESEDWEYEIKSMIVYNDKLYISVNEIPGRNSKAATEFSELLYGKYYGFYTKEEMEALRAYRTAAVLVWDDDTDECKVIYAENGKRAYDLSINDENQLVWHIECVEAAEEVGANSYSRININSVYEYIFDENNEIVNIVKMNYYNQEVER